MIESRLHEVREHRMSAVWLTLELWVKLAADKVWVVAELHHFHELSIGGKPRQLQACLFKLFAILIVHLKDTYARTRILLASQRTLEEQDGCDGMGAVYVTPKRMCSREAIWTSSGCLRDNSRFP